MREKNRSFTVEWGDNSIKISHWVIYLLYFLLSLIAYGMFLQKHYSYDSYINSPILNTTVTLSAGRFGFYLVNIFFNAINFNLVEHQSIFTFTFIATISFLFASLFIKLIEKSGIKQLFLQIGFFSGIALTLINVYTLEWVMFPEVMIVYAFALIFAYIAACVITSKYNIFTFLLSSCLVFLSMIFYQGALPAFVTWSYLLTFFSWKETSPEKKEKRIGFLLPALSGIAGALLSFVANFLYQHFASGATGSRTQMGSISEKWAFFKELILWQPIFIKDASGFLPPFSLLLFLVAILLILILSNSPLKTKETVFYFLAMIIVIWGSTFLPNLFLNGLWLTPRTITGFFFLVAFIFLVTVYWMREISYQKILAVIGVVFLGLNIFQIQFIGVNHYKSNRLDEEYAYLIEQEITRYESESGNTVTKIAVIRDAQPLQGYPGVHYSMYEINMRSYFATWADVGTLNYYTGNSYQKIEWTNNELAFELAGRNWDAFVPSEQLFFDVDTLYWVIY